VHRPALLQEVFLKSTIGCIIGIIFFVGFYTSNNQYTLAQNGSPEIYSKDSKPHGIPYNQWISKWWQWSQSIPGSVHPREHPSEQNCKVSQQGPVWFLADLLSGKQERTCTVPTGKSILVALVGGFCGADSAGVKNDEDLRHCATAGDDYASMKVTLDGKEIKNLDQNRVQTGFFNITYGNDNIYKHKPGMVKGFADGYYLFLKPLPPGSHVLELKTSVVNPVNSEFNYSADLIYHLNAKP
jgi:hypothetical protein